MRTFLIYFAATLFCLCSYAADSEYGPCPSKLDFALLKADDPTQIEIELQLTNSSLNLTGFSILVHKATSIQWKKVNRKYFTATGYASTILARLEDATDEEREELLSSFCMISQNVQEYNFGELFVSESLYDNECHFFPVLNTPTGIGKFYLDMSACEDGVYKIVAPATSNTYSDFGCAFSYEQGPEPLTNWYADDPVEITLYKTGDVITADSYVVDFVINGICYFINGDNESVTVVCQNSSSPSYPELDSNLTIPSSVIYNGKTYSVTSIGGKAFNGCSSLTSVTIPASVSSISTSAFNGCTNLRSIYSKILAPENVSYGTSIFNGVSINYCKLYVPVGTLDSYQFTAPWSDFLNIIEYADEPTYVKGDANGDGTVNVGDYVDVASYILEQDPQPFVFAAADIDDNNDINVGDLVGVAYIALTYEAAPHLAPAVDAPEAVIIAMDATVNSIASGEYEVALNLNNNVAISALQMDINLPQGMTLVDASLSDRASASHQIVFNQLANGDYRLLTSSSALKCFKNYDGAVLTLTLAGNPDSNGRLSGIKFAAPSSTCYSVDDIELNFNPTGIDNVTTAARIYSDGSNIIIDSPTDGTAQIILPNGMNKTVKVTTGRNVYESPTKGLVIVKMSNKVEKLQF